nr:centrosomal protein of 85 kDa [Ciona intestinalis]|eukprot:XP_026690094.1 centrosomal protein of 85 kDa [Ciona intestinalis]
MSRNLSLPRKKPGSTKPSPYKQRLQTNLPKSDISYASKSSTQLETRVKKTGTSFTATNTNMTVPRSPKADSNLYDLIDNDSSTTGTRPEVLSIDSDFDSGNGLTESPDQEAYPFSNSKLTHKINYDSENDLKTPECNPSWLGKKGNLPNISVNHPYYTPPTHLTTAMSRVNLGKKDLSAELEGKKDSPPLIAPDPVTGGHNRLVKGVYGRSTVNGHSKAVIPSVTETDRESHSSRSSSASDSHRNGKTSDVDRVGQEEMDMKFADITHMQLKRSLDQIHGVNSARSVNSGLSNQIYVGVPNVADACYSHDMNGNTHFSKPWRHNSAGNYYQQGAPAYDNGNVATQPNKFDAILQVKDAMLQEKESVILKLRLQVASLQHQIQEGDAALRQVMSTHYGGISKSSSSSSNDRSLDLETQRKIHDLEQMLGKVENNLEETKAQAAREKSHSEEKVKKLENLLKSREHTLTEGSKKYKVCTERLEKYKKRVESLERYLGGLPTVEESNKLKTEADILGVERENMIVEINKIKDKLETKTKALKEKQNELDKEMEKSSHLEREVQKLKEDVLKLEKSKVELGSSERDRLEDLEFEIVRLKKEKEDAARMLSASDRRAKQQQERLQAEVENLTQQLSEGEERIETLRKDMLMKQQTANKVHTAMMNLSSQNQQLMEQKLTLQDKVKVLEKAQGNFKDEAVACARLHRETFAAVQDIKAVSQVLIQTAEGNDPNLSALLGVTTEPNEDSVNKLTDAKTSVEQTNRKIIEVRKLRQDIDELRTIISNRYAESIGDNCTTH